MAWGMNLALGQAVDFESQIKPLLSDRCFACHGPDENARKADLHLYSREGAMEVGGAGVGVVLGQRGLSRASGAPHAPTQ